MWFVIHLTMLYLLIVFSSILTYYECLFSLLTSSNIGNTILIQGDIRQLVRPYITLGQDYLVQIE